MALRGAYHLMLLPTSLVISNRIKWIMYIVAPGCRHRCFSAAPKPVDPVASGQEQRGLLHVRAEAEPRKTAESSSLALHTCSSSSGRPSICRARRPVLGGGDIDGLWDDCLLTRAPVF